MVEKTFLNLGYILRVNINNLNSSENPGNLVLLKKVQDVNGNYFAYISGQAFRYYLKQTLMQIGLPITKIDKNGEYIVRGLEKLKTKEEKYKYIIENCLDIDLFGFMIAVKGIKEGALRRWSPTKVSPLVSIYPWKGETDLLTRKKEGQAGGDIVKVEINTFNFMRGTTIINVDEVGSYVDELNWEIKDIIGNDKRKERIEKLLEAFKNLNGGGKTARLLDDLTPKFLIITKQNSGTPIFLNSLSVDENENLNLDLIKETLDEYSDIVDKYIIGIRQGIFRNENDIREKFRGNVLSVKEAIEKAKGWI